MEDKLRAIFCESLGVRANIVPIGEALGFDPVWDGTDLFVGFSRRITIPKNSL